MHERFLPLYELSSFCPTASAEHVRPGAAAPSGYPSSNAAAVADEVRNSESKEPAANTVNNLRSDNFMPN